MRNEIKVNCPTCKKTVIWNDESPSRPFCSKRCKLIDFGGWASESHKIEGQPLTETEFDELLDTNVISEETLFSLVAEKNKLPD